MADLTITAANVIAGSGADVTRGIAGATVTAGQAVYLDTASTGKWLLADSDAASAITRGSASFGVALNGASNGQPLAVQTGGDITIGATMTAGVAYYLSDAPGAICPFADLATGDYVTLIGIAKSTTVLAIDPLYSGVVAL
jgi:hypothetical protein